MKYRFIKENRSNFPVVKMCQNIKVSVGGYYHWRILYSREVVGWDLSQKLTANSTCRAFGKYLYRYNRPKGVLVHSDRGIQYASEPFRSLLDSVNAV